MRRNANNLSTFGWGLMHCLDSIIQFPKSVMIWTYYKSCINLKEMDCFLWVLTQLALLAHHVHEFLQGFACTQSVPTYTSMVSGFEILLKILIFESANQGSIFIVWVLFSPWDFGMYSCVLYCNNNGVFLQFSDFATAVACLKVCLSVLLLHCQTHNAFVDLLK